MALTNVSFIKSLFSDTGNIDAPVCFVRGVLTVYCPTAVTKAMLDTEAVAAVLREVTGQSVGQAIAVRFVVGEPEDGKKRDKFQDLLRMGSKFDNFNIK